MNGCVNMCCYSVPMISFTIFTFLFPFDLLYIHEGFIEPILVQKNHLTQKRHSGANAACLTAGQDKGEKKKSQITPLCSDRSVHSQFDRILAN